MNQTLCANFLCQIQNNVTGNQSVTLNGTRSDQEQVVILVAIICLSSLCFLLGTVANIIVLIILHKKGTQRTVFDLTIASLSVTDLLTCLSGYGYAACELALYHFPHSRNDASEASSISGTVLKIASFFFVLSLLHVLLITFQRFCAIFWPIRYRQVMTKTLIKKIIATMWIFLLVLYSVAFVLFEHKKDNPMNGIIIITFGGILLSIYIMITVKICLLLKKKQFDWKAEHRVLLNSFGVTISYFACFSPYAYLTLMKGNASSVEFDLFMAITLVNFVLDPLFYFYLSYWLNRRDENRRNNPL